MARRRSSRRAPGGRAVLTGLLILAAVAVSAVTFGFISLPALASAGEDPALSDDDPTASSRADNVTRSLGLDPEGGFLGRSVAWIARGFRKREN